LGSDQRQGQLSGISVLVGFALHVRVAGGFGQAFGLLAGRATPVTA